MATNTTQYNFQKPEVGGDSDNWGDMLNGNWDATDSLLRGATALTRIGIGTTNTTLPLICNAATTADIAASFSGLVGIGTTSPQKALHINAGTSDIAIRVESADAEAEIEFIDDTTTSTTTSPRVGGVGNEFFVRTNGSQRMRIDSSGNVGIGTIDPVSRLDVRGDISVGGSGAGATQLGVIRSWSNTADADIYALMPTSSTTAGTIIEGRPNAHVVVGLKDNDNNDSFNVIGTGGTYNDSGSEADNAYDKNLFCVRGTGSVGIGTNSPSEKLVVKGGTHAANQSGGMALQMGDESGSHWKARFKIKSDSSGVPRTVISGVANASGGSIDAINISNAGNVGIGTDNPDYKLDVSRADVGTLARFQTEDGTHNPRIDISTTSTGAKIRSAFSTGIAGSLEIESAGGSSYISFNPNSTERMRIDSSGRVDITAANYAYNSTNYHIRMVEDDGSAYLSNIQGGLYLQAGGRYYGSSVYQLTDGATSMSSIAAHQNGEIKFYSATGVTANGTVTPSMRMAIKDDGKVGIGTNSPDGLLHLSGGASGDVAVIVEADTDNTGGENDNPKVELRQDGGGVIGKFYMEGGAGVSANSTISNATVLEAAATSGNNDLQFVTGGTTGSSPTLGNVRATIRHDGKFGIGTQFPTHKLEVQEASPTDGVLASFVNSTNAGGTKAAIQFSNSDNTLCTTIIGSNRVGANYGADFYVANSDSTDGTITERFRIDEDGKVNIPNLLQVNTINCRPDTTNFAGQQLVLNAGESSTYATGQEDEKIYLNAENGIDITSTPDNWATYWAGRKTTNIQGDSATFGGTASFADTITAKNATFDNGDNTTVSIVCNDSGNAVLNLQGTNQGTGVLYVGQSSTHGGGIEYNGDSTPATSGGGSDEIVLYRRSSSVNYWTAKNTHSDNDWSFRGSITQNASDERLKENITPIENALEKVEQLRGVTFDWKDDVEEKGFIPYAKHETGVIAQDVQKVIPDAAVPAPFDENYLTVKHEKIIPLLIEAIKELKAEVESLKN